MGTEGGKSSAWTDWTTREPDTGWLSDGLGDEGVCDCGDDGGEDDDDDGDGDV